MRRPQGGHRELGVLRTLRWLCAALMFTAAFGAATAWGQGKTYRVKIDEIDTKEAPEIKIYATFLDDTDNPVNPEHIDLSEVLLDGRIIESKEVDRGVWAEDPAGTDLVLVMPATKRLGASAFEILQEALPEMMAGFGENDRVALVTYSRAVTVDAELSTEKKAGDAYKKAVRTGVRPFMFSALDRAITILQPSPEKRKKAIIFIGDGTDAATIKVEELNEKVKELVDRARKADVKIWTVGFATGGLNPSDTRTLRLISRKTGATYREAPGQRQLREALEQAVGEIVGQLILTIHPDVEEQKTYEFVVRLQSEHGPETESEPYSAKVESVKTNWVLVGVVSALCCIIGAVTLIVLILILRKISKDRARREAEELLADLLSEREERCDTCHRVMKPEWEECVFCAQGMKPLDWQEREPPFVYDDQDRKLCNICGRAAADDWKACAFCAKGHEPLPEWRKKKEREAMLLGKVDPETLTKKMMQQQEEEQKAIRAAQEAATAEAGKKMAAVAQGGRECPTCGRMMAPHWPECLHCASGLPPIK